MTTASLSIGIASRNRPVALARCINSTRLLGNLVAEVIVVDDGSDMPLEADIRPLLDASAVQRLRVIRFQPGRGLAAARSDAVRQARNPWVLNLDDDAVILSAKAVHDAIATMASDPAVFAVAFAQAQADGTPWPPAAQPAPGAGACQSAAFIGFAHLVRRDAFISLGGFRSQLIINGEERELCLRALDAGLTVVYLPDARIGHLADPVGRDTRRYLHLTVRNGVLASVYDDPLPLLCLRIPLRLLAYFRMRREWNVHDPGGFAFVLKWLWHDLPDALRQRRPVRWSTIRRWRSLTRRAPPYRGAT